MLDNENSAESTAPQSPPRRRRAASRPAGAPRTGPSEATSTSATQEKSPAEQAQNPSTEQAQPELVESHRDDAGTSDDLTPKRRRATAKSGAEPATRRRRVKAVEAKPDAEESSTSTAPSAPESAESPTPESASLSAPAAEANVSDSGPEADAPTKPTRRRATRKTAAPQPVDAAEPTPTPTPEPESVPDEASVASAPAAESAPAPRTRRRATRPAAAPEPVEASTPAPQEERSEEVSADADSNPEPRAAGGNRRRGDADSDDRPQRGRRRRGNRAASAPESDPTEGDPIGDALRAAEELAQTRRAVLADPFLTAAAREEQLAALAGAIAGGEPAEDEAEDASEESEPVTDAETQDDEQAPADESETEDDSDDEAEDNADDDRPLRRRRRRGGRRRRRGNARDENDSDDSDDDSDEAPAGDSNKNDESDSDDASDDTGNGDESDNGTTRRRRRRRRGEGSSKESSSDDTVTGIEGSTRMEAKRQRRKESRAAGRRRAPVLSEAEFLTRRESVDRKLVIRQSEDYTQLAVIEDDILVEHYVDKASATSLIGNIYVGKVQNVLPSMEAAFIDIGRGRNAVLYAGEVDWDNFGVSGENRRVENVLKSGQSVLVQVTKDPVGAKGARLTSHISLPGRYVVYSPGGHLSGISRKLPDTERNRLRQILGSLISDDESVIVRTAAEGASEEELVRDVNRLKAQWEIIERKSKQGSAPQALYSEPDLTLRIVRDLFTEDFGALIAQGDGGPEDVHDAIAAYVSHVAPHLAERVQRFEVRDDGKDLFAQYKIDEQIAKALDRKVFLPSGGSLVIDRTEAMTVIDVNTGRFTGTGGNLESTVTSNNLEAAEEIVRQLRLRDIGGIIVIDFIDMVLPSNRELLLRRLVECLGRDRTRHQVAEVTSLGLVQLTRKRIGTGLHEAFTEPCEHCNGAGYHRFEEPVESQAPADGGEGKSSRRRGRGK